jgi:hypothetical protein
VAAVAARADEYDGVRRICIDGAAATDPHRLGAQVVASLAGSRPAVHVRADDFWRPAGQRFEYGRQDAQAYLEIWLDADALRREVLDSVESRGTVLPGLRDPLTDRSLRRAPVELGENPAVVVSGTALLGRRLPFELTVHLRMSPSALARRTPEGEAWTLEALARYAADVSPETTADLVVRCDDPQHPALVVR